jgi:hypothetical protein
MVSERGARVAARILLVVAFVAASIGYDAWLAARVVFDRATIASAAHAVIETPAVHRALAEQLTKTVEDQVPAARDDPRLAAAVRAALDDPRVTAAFTDTVLAVYDEIVSPPVRARRDGPATFTVDGRAIGAALHDALARTDPALAARVDRLPPLVVHVNADDLPHLDDPKSRAGGIAVAAGLAALVSIAGSLLFRHDRRAVARVGRNVAYLSIVPLLACVLLPRVLEHRSAGPAQVAVALLDTFRPHVLPSAIALLAGGAALALIATFAPRPGAAAGDRPGAGRGPSRPAAGPSPAGPPPQRPDEPAITEKLYL